MATPTPDVIIMVIITVRPKIRAGGSPGENHGIAAEQKRSYKKTGICPNHEYVPVGEIDQEQHPVDHRIAQSYQGVKAPPLQGVKQVL